MHFYNGMSLTFVLLIDIGKKIMNMTSILNSGVRQGKNM